MKVAKVFSALFALAGTVLMVGTAILCFASIDSSVKILENPEGAIACSEQFREHVQAGNFTEVSKMIYGKPALGAEGTPEDPCTARLWQAWRESISLEYSRMYLAEGELGRDGELTVLDVSKVTEGVNRRAKAALAAKGASAGEGETLPQKEREEILLQALQDALREDADFITQTVYIKLVFRDGAWWAVPDTAFFQTLSVFGT